LENSGIKRALTLSVSYVIFVALFYHHENSIRERGFKLGELRYSEILEVMTELVCRFLPDGTITFTNRACNEQFGGEQEDLKGKNFFKLISSDENELTEKDFRIAAANAALMLSAKRMVGADSVICHIRWSCQGLFNEHGFLIEYQAVGRDITDLRKRQVEKKEQDRWQRRTQKLEAIGTLSAGIAHDFNNIIAVILGNAQLAMDDVSKGSRTRKNLNEIYDSCLRARDIVKQILAFSREGDQEIRPLSLIPVVKESIKFLKATIPSIVEIRGNIRETDFVNADPTQVGQVVMNLGTNAAYAIGDAPGVLEINLENVIIGPEHGDRFRVPIEGKYVRLMVKDTGRGMSPKVISRVFDPYFTTKKEGVGTGMGLAVVHGIIDNHKGTIWANSDPGKGTTFQVLFPAVEGEFTEESSHPGFIFGGKEHILVVDDEKALLEAEINMLERLEYEVIGTTSPIDALKIFRKQPGKFDLVYTDMTMPGMTGLTLAKKVMEIRPDLPVILYSGHRGLEDNNEIGSSGIKAFLTKPIILEDLASTIRRVLDNEKNKL
jgi:PAS domain S-box-containing protein